MRRFAFLLLVALPAAPTHAATSSTNQIEVIDQSNEAVWNPFPDISSLGAYPDVSPAQVVTPGINGKLSRIELGVGRPGVMTSPLLVDIVEVYGQTPWFAESGRIATRTIDASDVPLRDAREGVSFNLSVDFSASNIFLTPGKPFAIVLRTLGAEPYSWTNNVNDLDTYSGGMVFQYRSSFGNVSVRQGDTHFRTFVLVPEPTAATICGALLPVIALIRRRNRPLPAPA